MSPIPDTPARARRPKIFWLLLVLSTMLIAGIAAFCSMAFISFPAILADPTHYPWGSLGSFFLMAVLAGLLAGLPIWWLIVERPGRITRRRGAVAGILSSIAAHPLVWIIYMLLFSFSSPERGGAWSTFSEHLGDVLAYSIIGLIWVGWLTTAVGYAGGVLFIKYRHVLMRHLDK